MAIPDYQTLMLPMLRLGAEGSIAVRDCLPKIAAQFALTEGDLDELLPSGRQTVIYNRMHWAVTYMVKAGLLERPERGHFKATERGRQLLEKNPERIDNELLSGFQEFQDFKAKSQTPVAGDEPNTKVPLVSTTPEETIEAAFQELNADLRSDLLDRIVAADPAFFEILIIDLMVAMGYGDAGRAQHVGQSHDGGIDGIINEDPLGLDVVFLQAKRYAPGNNISVDQIRSFAGSLDERGAVKGVFVTTSQFAGPAQQYAERSPKSLILIDGEKLTELLVRYGVGVRTFRKIELRRVDTDYFDISS